MSHFPRWPLDSSELNCLFSGHRPGSEFGLSLGICRGLEGCGRAKLPHETARRTLSSGLSERVQDRRAAVVCALECSDTMLSTSELSSSMERASSWCEFAIEAGVEIIDKSPCWEIKCGCLHFESTYCKFQYVYMLCACVVPQGGLCPFVLQIVSSKNLFPAMLALAMALGSKRGQPVRQIGTKNNNTKHKHPLLLISC